MNNETAITDALNRLEEVVREDPDFRCQECGANVADIETLLVALREMRREITRNHVIVGLQDHATDAKTQGEPSEEQVEAAARTMFDQVSSAEAGDYTWAELVRSTVSEDIDRAYILRDQARQVLRSATAVTDGA